MSGRRRDTEAVEQQQEAPAELMGGPLDGKLIVVPLGGADQLPLEFLKVTGWTMYEPHRGIAGLRRHSYMMGAYERDGLLEDTRRWRYQWRAVEQG